MWPNRSTLWRAMLGLVLPRGCAGCDMPDEVLCHDCAGLLCRYVTRPLPGALLGVTFACGTYRDGVRRAVLNWKDHGDQECDRPFTAACTALVDAVALPSVLRELGGEVSIVPAPSSVSSMRTRGRRHLWPIAKGLAQELAARGIDASAVDALHIAQSHGKSVQTSSAAERATRLGERGMVGERGKLSGRQVLLLDDIVTTGTTMRRCVQAVRRSGGTVVAGIALAATRDVTGRYDISAV